MTAVGKAIDFLGGQKPWNGTRRSSALKLSVTADLCWVHHAPKMQFWNIDTANLTATVVKTSHRQMLTMAPRLNVKPIADEIRVAISEGRERPADQVVGSQSG